MTDMLEAKSLETSDTTDRNADRWRKVSTHLEPFVVIGERGTGKTKLAQSASGTQVFVAISCDESTALSEIRAAMQPASTCCLTEVTLLPMALQQELWRCVEEHKEARLVATTTRELSVLVERGVFCAELHRLFKRVLTAPPLRTQQDTIEAQAMSLAAREAKRLGVTPPRFQSQILDALKSYDFPGNQRELRNMVEQALVLANGRPLLTLGDFPVLARSIRPAAFARRPKATPSRLDLRAIKRQAEEEEYERIVAALRETDGNVSAAARSLELSRYQLIRRMKKFGMD